MRWWKKRRQKRYANDVLRELLYAAIRSGIDAEKEAVQHKAALRRWADAHDAEWSEMSTEDQKKCRTRPYYMTDVHLMEYIDTLINEVAS